MTDLWSLPDTAEVSGKEYSICTDYRDILQIIDVLDDINEDNTTKAIVAMSLFYDDFDSIPVDKYDDAVAAMLGFISAGEPDGGGGPKLIDWGQDAGIIVSEVNKVAGCETRAMPHLHWWTFVGYFRAIGEGQLSYIVGIRDKIARGKALEEHERRFYHQNRAVVDIKKSLSKAEEDTLKLWMGKG